MILDQKAEHKSPRTNVDDKMSEASSRDAGLINASPFSILRAAIQAVPAVKYALGMLGIVAAISVAKLLVSSFRVAALGCLVTLVLMVMLLVFAAATKLVAGSLKVAALILVYSFLAVSVATVLCLFSSVFFKWPVDLRSWLTVETRVIPPESDPPPKLAIAKWIGFAPFYVAAKDGKLTNWQLVDLAPSRLNRRDLILGNKITAYTGTIDETIIDIEREAMFSSNPTAILLLSRSEGGDAVIARNGITSLSALKGHRIGAWAGGTAHFLLAYRLSQLNPKIQQLDFIHVEQPQDLIDGFAGSRYDAIATWSPWVQEATKFGRIIAKTEKSGPPDIIDALYIIDRAFLVNHQSDLFSLFRAWDYGVNKIKGGNADEDLGEWLNLSPEQVVDARTGVRFFSVSDNFQSIPSWEDQIVLVREQCRKAGLLQGGERPRIATDAQPARKYVGLR